ncbi:MAG: NAD(P)H-hydrate epimerase, partial [Rhodocyclaceae bacterium]
MDNDSCIAAGRSRPIHSVAGIRAIEARFLPDADPPLMERAGAAVAQQARGLVGSAGGDVVFLAGPGNNGGDAFVAARLLVVAGHPVTVVFAGDPGRLPEDARNAYSAFRAAGGATVTELPARTDGISLAVDGLFGIGLGRPLEGRYAAWVAWLNGLACPVLAIDIPSGLDADSGRVLGCAVWASHTATFIALKPGLLTLDGPDHCGRITVHDIDLPTGEFAAAGRTLARDLFADCLVPRPRNSHKGSW